MTVCLTSFKRWHENPSSALDLLDTSRPVRAFSVAVYQPGWYVQLPKLDLFDIRDDKGAWVRPRNFIPEGHDGAADPALLRAYHDTLLNMYRARTPVDVLISGQWHDVGISGQEHQVLCCWCPYDRAAKRQLRDYGSFVCHTWPIETFLRELGIEVVRDADRENMVR